MTALVCSTYLLFILTFPLGRFARSYAHSQAQKRFICIFNGCSTQLNYIPRINALHIRSNIKPDCCTKRMTTYILYMSFDDISTNDVAKVVI